MRPLRPLPRGARRAFQLVGVVLVAASLLLLTLGVTAAVRLAQGDRAPSIPDAFGLLLTGSVLLLGSFLVMRFGFARPPPEPPASGKTY